MTIFHPVRTRLSRHLTPPRIFILSFALLILAGSVLLYLPFSAGGRSLSFVDALFSSASAVCVTGLTVIDIGRDLSFAGQGVTLVLFQIGGLGILTFSVIVFGMMGRGISFRGREIIQTTFLNTPRRDFIVIIKGVLQLTFCIEAAGTALLFVRFCQDFPPATAFCHALYHAVSAFNNCGYSLFSDNLMSYRGDWLVNLTVMGLIVLGGIGFIVQLEVIDLLRGVRKRLSLHTKMVLLTTASLIAAGAVLFYLFEMDCMLKGVPWPTQLLDSLFQSITPRTAGFNTVDIGKLTNATILVMMILMFIGASPGSTGGGIKTTSFTLLLLIIWNRLKGNERVNVMNRQIPREVLGRTIAIIFAAAFSICLITSLLLIFGKNEGMVPEQNRALFVEYLFETISAFGTVGLSMGATAKLNDAQKLAVVLMMFAGRVGPLALAFSWFAEKKRKVRYAEESVMVG
ncbi:MAG: TrkH family potassium uptake protein [Deltaproteobacteria bacterium]|nr:TrkH family potassium uptake protein [Deltaproteobacteria bacterium]